jgi:hypothetical protein
MSPLKVSNKDKTDLDSKPLEETFSGAFSRGGHSLFGPSIPDAFHAKKHEIPVHA